MRFSTFEVFRKRFLRSVRALALAGTGALVATGVMAQTNFDALSNDTFRLKMSELTTYPQVVDEVNIPWTMGNSLAPSAEVRYSTSINIRDESKIRGRLFIHREVTQTAANRVWFEYRAEPFEVQTIHTNTLSSCDNQHSSGTGYCKAPLNSELQVQQIPSGEKFIHYAKLISSKKIEIGIINDTKKKTYVLGTINTTNSTGLGSNSFRSHITFLGSRPCSALPVVTYTLHKGTSRKGTTNYDYKTGKDEDRAYGTCNPAVNLSNVNNVTVKIPG